MILDQDDWFPAFQAEAHDLQHARARKSLAILDGKIKADPIIDPDKLPLAPEGLRSASAERFMCPKCGGRMSFAPDGRLFQVGYAGSFYDNDNAAFVWDSPLTLTDAVSNPAQGRMAIFPSSVSHTVSALGAWPLPRRSRVHAYVSIGTWSQDEALVPHTINTALAAPPLSRPSADADARIIATNLGFNTRPGRHLMLNGRFRIYDFDNRTPPFAQPQYVRADQTVTASVLGASEPFEYRRQFLDLNAVYSGLRFASVRLGYGLEHDDRRYRFLERTTDHVLRASVDTANVGWLALRAQYGAPLDRTNAWRVVKRAAQSAGIRAPVSPVTYVWTAPAVSDQPSPASNVWRVPSTSTVTTPSRRGRSSTSGTKPSPMPSILWGPQRPPDRMSHSAGSAA